VFVHNMKKIILLVLLSITLSACAGASGGTDAPVSLGTPTSHLQSGCSVPAQWVVEYTRSGGIAGFNESLTLDSGGRLTVESERPAAAFQETLSKEQVDAIAGLLARACPFEMNPNDAGCADCYLYKLVVQMDGRSYVLLATDVTLTEELHPLISELSGLLEEPE
jgi:hypothetical protein